MIGILPTLTPEHLAAETFSANPRYAMLNEQILAARGEEFHIDIAGIQVALGANSPFLFGRELWRETRIVCPSARAPHGRRRVSR